MYLKLVAMFLFIKTLACFVPNLITCNLFLQNVVMFDKHITNCIKTMPVDK